MNSKLPVEAHLTEEVLVRSLDGELDKRANENAARHLNACWTCRSKREQLRQAMDRFVQLEEALIDASSTAPHAGVIAQANQPGIGHDRRSLGGGRVAHAVLLCFGDGDPGAFGGFRTAAAPRKI
jgi:anti-sigma factor RsiW